MRFSRDLPLNARWFKWHIRTWKYCWRALLSRFYRYAISVPGPDYCVFSTILLASLLRIRVTGPLLLLHPGLGTRHWRGLNKTNRTSKFLSFSCRREDDWSYSLTFCRNIYSRKERSTWFLARTTDFSRQLNGVLVVKKRNKGSGSET